MSSAGSALGTGGMSTKIVAAKLATSAGVTTVITRSSNPGNIFQITSHVEATRSSHLPSTNGTSTPASDHRPGSPSRPPSTDPAAGRLPLHTRFLPSPSPVRDRYFWLLHGLKPHGTVYIDGGAHRALLGKAGLLPAGVVDVEGAFAQQEAVRLCVVSRTPAAEGAGEKGGSLWDGPAVEVGRALVNYAATEIARIKGRQSMEIAALLGYADSEYVAQREHVSLFQRDSRPVSPAREVASPTREKTVGDAKGRDGYGGAGTLL